MNHYGLSRDEAMFYIVREEADKDNSSGALGVLRAIRDNRSRYRNVTRAVRDTVELSWLMYEDIWRCVRTLLYGTAGV
jgi:hypothetical protein